MSLFTWNKKSAASPASAPSPATRRGPSRRVILKGIGGFTLALPVLEGLRPREVEAAGEESAPPFAIFFRQANGVAAAQTTNEIGMEPERWWPTQLGALTPETVAGRALAELTDHLDKLLVVKNVSMFNFNYADGHARGALQCLTARGPVVEGVGGDSEANGESLDHRIGAELNPDGRDSLFMYAGTPGGWLGGPCISYRGPNQRRAALHNPINAYQTMMGIDSEQFELVIARQNSINDLVRDQMTSLMSSPKLSAADKQRLELHFDSIRDLEDNLMCNLSDEAYAELEGKSPGYASDLGDEVLQAARAHMDIAVLAVACGYTRSAAIQIGSGNDGSTRYSNLDDNAPMENFHYLSHRRLSHDAMGDVIPNSDLLHHYVDIHFMRAYKYLLDKLSAVELINGDRLLDCGVAVFLNDLGNGPAHSARDVPIVLAGSAGGLLKQGQHVTVNNGDYLEGNHAQLLNTIGTAAGLRKNGDQYLDDFGDPALPKGVLSELLA